MWQYKSSSHCEPEYECEGMNYTSDSLAVWNLKARCGVADHLDMCVTVCPLSDLYLGQLERLYLLYVPQESERPSMTPNISHAAVLVTAAAASVYVIRAMIKRRNLPPGPKGIPVFGNFFQFSTSPWKDFEAWKQEYGK